MTPELLDNLFKYDDGFLYWKKRPHNRGVRAIVGEKAGYIDAKGYQSIQILGKAYKTHRLVFMMFNGYFPQTVDHIDGDKLNNRIENLRGATISQNCANRGAPKNSSTGIKNVSYRPRDDKFIVSVNGKHIGQYADLELANLVAVMAREKYHKEFAHHG